MNALVAKEELCLRLDLTGFRRHRDLVLLIGKLELGIPKCIRIGEVDLWIEGVGIAVVLVLDCDRDGLATRTRREIESGGIGDLLKVKAIAIALPTAATFSIGWGRALHFPLIVVFFPSLLLVSVASTVHPAAVFLTSHRLVQRPDSGSLITLT